MRRTAPALALGAHLLIIIVLAGLPEPLRAQPNEGISLDSCQSWARKEVPLNRQFALQEALRDNAIRRDNTTRLPQWQAAGQATYQSDVTRIPQPNGEFLTLLSRDQYNLYGEVAQPITDLFLADDQRAVITAGYEVDKQRLEVDLRAVTERVNLVFFAVLMLDRQGELNRLLQEDLRAGRRKLEAAVAAGVAIRSQVLEIDAELLRINQQDIELAARRKGLMEMMSLLTGHSLLPDDILQVPYVPMMPMTVSRPELALFDAQHLAIDAQRKIIGHLLIPKFSLFLRGGIGRPALNLFKDELSPYYIGGLRMQWPLSALYTVRKDQQRLDLQAVSTDIRRDQFNWQTSLNIRNLVSEIDRFESLRETDEELIRLRDSISTTARDQLASGVITATDYIAYVNASSRAREQQALHDIQYLQSMYNLKTEMGNE